jgi:hypothetical protein
MEHIGPLVPGCLDDELVRGCRGFAKRFRRVPQLSLQPSAFCKESAAPGGRFASSEWLNYLSSRNKVTCEYYVPVFLRSFHCVCCARACVWARVCVCERVCERASREGLVKFNHSLVLKNARDKLRLVAFLSPAWRGKRLTGSRRGGEAEEKKEITRRCIWSFRGGPRRPPELLRHRSKVLNPLSLSLSLASSHFSSSLPYVSFSSLLVSSRLVSSAAKAVVARRCRRPASFSLSLTHRAPPQLSLLRFCSLVACLHSCHRMFMTRSLQFYSFLSPSLLRELLKHLFSLLSALLSLVSIPFSLPPHSLSHTRAHAHRHRQAHPLPPPISRRRNPLFKF